MGHGGLHNIPEFLESATELEGEMGIGVVPATELTYLATCDRCTQWILTDTDFFINDVIGKVIPTASHRTDKDSNGVRLWERGQVFGQPDGLSVTGQC